MAYICGDLLVEILSRLPVKSLLRFKCVSRFWYDLINDPNFIKLHLHRSIQTNSNQTLIFKYRESLYLHSAEFYTLNHIRALGDPLLSGYNAPYVLGSCNGLLWLANCPPSEKLNSGLLYNPAIRSYHKLPCLPNWNKFSECWGCGFGYDSAHDDYKVMSIIKYAIMDKDELHAESKWATMVYSLKDNSWRKGQNFPYHNFWPRMRHAVLANGYLYWYVHQKSWYHDKRILGFNISDETYKELELPKHDISLLGLRMGALDGYLCLMLDCMTHCDLLILKEHGGVESWTKFLRITLNDRLDCTMMTIKGPVRVIGFSKSRRELLILHDYRYLASYSLEHRASRRVEIGGLSKFQEPLICVESLISPKERLPTKNTMHEH